MTQTSSATESFLLGGVSVTNTSVRTGDRVQGYDLSLPASPVGLISAAGIDTLPTGHGIAQSDIIDVHWDDSGTGDHKVRRGLTVDVATTNAIEFDETPAGEGDTLPSQGTSVFAAKQVVITNLSIEGDNILMFAAGADVKSVIDIRQNSSTSKQVTKIAIGEGWSWIVDSGDTNPFAAITSTIIRASNGSGSVGTLTVGIHYDL